MRMLASVIPKLSLAPSPAISRTLTPSTAVSGSLRVWIESSSPFIVFTFQPFQETLISEVPTKPERAAQSSSRLYSPFLSSSFCLRMSFWLLSSSITIRLPQLPLQTLPYPCSTSLGISQPDKLFVIVHQLAPIKFSAKSPFLIKLTPFCWSSSAQAAATHAPIIKIGFICIYCYYNGCIGHQFKLFYRTQLAKHFILYLQGQYTLFLGGRHLFFANIQELRIYLFGFLYSY